MNRMYSSKSILQLEEIFKQYQPNEFYMTALRTELSFRNSHRAKVLASEVGKLIPPLETNRHLIKDASRQPTIVPQPVDPAIEDFKKQKGLELLRNLKLLGEKLKAARDRLRYFQQSATVASGNHAAVLQKLQAYVFSIVPMANDSEEQPSTAFEKRRQLERIKLIQAAARSFPDQALLQRLETEKLSAEKTLRSAQRNCDEIKNDYEKLNQYYEKNERSILFAAEDETVLEAAGKIHGQMDEIALFRFVQETGLEDPIGILTRARLHATNVLGKPNRSDSN